MAFNVMCTQWQPWWDLNPIWKWHTHENTSDGDEDGKGIDCCIFSVEELRSSIRFEDGYDLYDPKYEAWLKINHPNAVSIPQMCLFLSRQVCLCCHMHLLLFLLEYLNLLPITCTHQALQTLTSAECLCLLKEIEEKKKTSRTGKGKVKTEGKKKKGATKWHGCNSWIWSLLFALVLIRKTLILEDSAVWLNLTSFFFNILCFNFYKQAFVGRTCMRTTLGKEDIACHFYLDLHCPHSPCESTYYGCWQIQWCALKGTVLNSNWV